MRINTDVTEWNHILSPTKVIKAIVAKADGDRSIIRDVTCAGLVVFGKSDHFTVEEDVVTTITIPCSSAQWLVLVDKENNLGQAHYNASPALYETILLRLSGGI